MNKMQEGFKKYREKVRKGEIVVKKSPSMVKAIRAKCKDCMNDFRDGRHDCEIEKCSLYYWMSYGRLAKERKRLKIKVENEPIESNGI